MTERPSPKITIQEHGLRPKKSFGQNFMMDQRVNAIFAQAAASFGKDLPLVEIGAGTGSLTSHLLEISATVHAIERDRDLVPLLKKQFAQAIGSGHLIVHEADGVRFELASVLGEDKPGVLLGNLPYHLTSSIIFLALKNLSVLKGTVFLVQKEVADRLLAKPSSKQYSFLTAVLGLAFIIERVAHVDKSAFWPVPKIDSAIIKMTTTDQGISQIEDVNKFIVFVREIFQKRRKKLSTILSHKMDKNDFIKLDIDPNLRPENLSSKEFLQMYVFCLHKND